MDTCWALKFTALILLECSFTWSPKWPTIPSATKLCVSPVSIMANTSLPSTMSRTYINPYVTTVFSAVTLTSCKALTLLSLSEFDLFISPIKAPSFSRFGKIGSTMGNHHKYNSPRRRLVRCPCAACLSLLDIPKLFSPCFFLSLSTFFFSPRRKFRCPPSLRTQHSSTKIYHRGLGPRDCL